MNWLLDTLEKCGSRLRQGVLFKKRPGDDRPNDLEWYDEQIIALNLLSEGRAFDFYRNTIPMSEKLKLLGGQPCDVNMDGDLHHLTKQLDPGDDIESGTAKARGGRVWHSARLYHQVLSFPVGEQVQTQEQI